MSPRRRPKQPAPHQGDERQKLLAAGAALAGEKWTQLWREELRAQGRRAVGGWPGTLSEARAHARCYCAAELRRMGWTELTTEELECAARRTYAYARDHWLSRAEREDPADG